MRDRGGATNLLLTGRDGASEIRSVRDCACVKNEIGILMSCYRHFNEEKIKLEGEWHNINQQVNMMKNQYMELRKRTDRLNVCFLTFYPLNILCANFGLSILE